VIADYTSASDAWSSFVIKESNYSWTDGWAIARNDGNEEIISFVDDYLTYDLINAQSYSTPFMATQFKNLSDLRLYLGGEKVQDVANSGFTNSSEPMRIGASQAASGGVRQYLDGNIAEIIIFDDNLKSSERILVNNYLSSKYGIATTGDKYIYDVNHPHEVFGIGRKNNGSNFVAISQGTGIVEISNPAHMDDEEFLLIGHDNAGLTAYYEDSPGEYTYRINRSWRVDEQGDVGTLNVSFDLSGLGLSIDAGEYALLIDDDGDFSNATIHITGATYSGSEISFTGVNFSDGDYFSLAAYNSVIWNGASYENGSGTSNAPNTSDDDRKFYVNGSGASLTSNANARNMVVAVGSSITVSGNSNLTVTNEIANNGTITVNDGAGLVQTHSGSSSNTGSGNYVINRNGNSSINSYNGFSSPVLSPTITTVFSGSNPCDIFAFESSSQLWKYDFANGYMTTCKGNSVTFNSTDVIVGGDNQMDLGRGYFVPGSGSSARSFSGNVNNGDINVSVFTAPNSGTGSWEGDDFNLIGNPYPSAISASAFWNENAINNSRINNAIYFWDDLGSGSGYDQNNDFAYWNDMGGTASSNGGGIPNGSIASGQGFFVIASSNTSVVFNNGMRGGTNTQFFKSDSNSDRSRFWFSCESSSGDFSQILLGFDDNATLGIDAGIDATRTKFSDGMYLASVSNNKPLAIQGRPHLHTQYEEEIPLEIYVSNYGVHVFELDSIEDQDDLYNMYLFDSLYGKLDLLNAGPSSVYLSDTGIYADRFFIKVVRTDIPNGIHSVEKETLVNAYFKNQQLFITNLSSDKVDHVHIYSVTGSKMYTISKINVKPRQGYDIPNLSSGIYFVSVVLEDGIQETIRLVYQ
jgi:hypothetical protein